MIFKISVGKKCNHSGLADERILGLQEYYNWEVVIPIIYPKNVENVAKYSKVWDNSKVQ